MIGNGKIITLLGIIFLISFINAASPNMGTFKQTECFDLRQVCFINGTQCDTCNITSVDYPENGSALVRDVTMTKNNADFNLSLCRPSVLGRYSVNGYCTYGADVKKPFVAYFDVTPSGKAGSSNTAFFIFVILLVYSTLFISFFYARNIPLTILSGMLMIFLGVYMIKNGIIIYRDALTNYLSYVTMSVGFVMSMWAALEQFEVI